MRCKRCDRQLLLTSEKELALCATCQFILSRPPLFESAFAYTDDDEQRPFIDTLDALNDAYPFTRPTPRFSPGKILAALCVPLVVTVVVTLVELDFLQRAAVTSKELLSLLALLASFYFAFKVIKEVSSS